MADEKLLFLDAQTKGGLARITTFGVEGADILADFRDWVIENNIGPDDLWYADIFETDGKRSMPKRIKVIRLFEGNKYAILDSPCDVNPYHRTEKPVSKLKEVLWKIVDFLRGC